MMRKPSKTIGTKQPVSGTRVNWIAMIRMLLARLGKKDK